jgi:hypothetical protein
MTIVDEYPSIPAEPWLISKDIPHSVTREVVDYWAKEAAPRGEFPCRKVVFTIKSHDQGWGGPAGCKGTYRGSSTWFDVGLETIIATRDSESPQFSNAKRDCNPSLLVSGDVERSTEAMPESHAPSPLPHFSIPDPQSSGANQESILCATRTIIPITRRETTATEPPEVKAEFVHRLDSSLDCLQCNKTAINTATEYVITWSCTDDTMDPDSIDAKKLYEEGRGRLTANGQYVRNLKIGDVVTVWGKARYGGWVNYVEEVKIEVYWAV